MNLGTSEETKSVARKASDEQGHASKKIQQFQGTYKKNVIHSFIHSLTHSFIQQNLLSSHCVLAPVREGTATRQGVVGKRDVIGPPLNLSVEPAVKSKH